jgi:hypothetical protein
MVVLGHLWTQPLSPRYTFDGVEGTRHLLPSHLLERGDKNRVRVRLEVPISTWDQRRVLATANTKMAFESQWAAEYAGIPLMAIEESDGAHGGTLHEDLRNVMSGAHTFAGILLTHYPANGLENVLWLPRQSANLGLHIQVQTMWETVQSYAGERPLVTLSSGTAFVDLDVRVRRQFELKVHPFRSEWHSVRLPYMGDVATLTNDPRFLPVIQKTIEVLREQQARLGPRPENEIIDLKWELEPLPDLPPDPS